MQQVFADPLLRDKASVMDRYKKIIYGRSERMIFLPGKYYILKNVAISGRVLFPGEPDYTLFDSIVSKHTSKVADIHAYFLTPYSYELLVRFKSFEQLSGRYRVDPFSIYKPVSAMLTDYVKRIQFKYQFTGSMFPRSYIKLLINNRVEADVVIRNMERSSAILHNVFGTPVVFKKLFGAH